MTRRRRRIIGWTVAALFVVAAQAPRVYSAPPGPLVRSVAAALQRQGVTVGPIDVQPLPETGAAVEGAAAAGAAPGILYLSAETALSVTEWDRLFRYPRGRRRADAWERCTLYPVAPREPTTLGYLCDTNTIAVVFHELVHLARYDNGSLGSRGDWFDEGLAEAIARDQWQPWVRRFSGGWELSSFIPPWTAYPGWTATVRWLSSRATCGPWQGIRARAWRLAQVTGARGPSCLE